MRKFLIKNFDIDLNPKFKFSGWMQWVILSPFIVLACLMFIPFSPKMPTDGLGGSWRYAVNEAVEHNLIFGRDFVFTFGPLGYVNTAVYSPTTDFMMLFMSAVFIAGFVISIFFSALKNRQWWLLLLPLVFSLPIDRDSFFLTFPLFFLLAIARITLPSSYFAHLSITPLRIAALAVSVYAIGIIPLVKASFIGVVLPVSCLAFFLLWFRSKKLALCFSSLLLFSVCMNWMISGQNFKDIIHYFTGIIPIISGYTNAMSSTGNYFSIVYFLFAAAIIILFFSREIFLKFGKQACLVIVGLILILFVSFKASFVRHDAHVHIALAVLLFVTYGASMYTKGWIAVCLWIVMGSAWSVIRESRVDLTPKYTIEAISRQWNRTLSGIKDRIYRPEFLVEKYERAKENIREKHPLPAPPPTLSQSLEV